MPDAGVHEQLLRLDRLELTLPHFNDRQPPCIALLASLPRHATRTWCNSKALVREPGFEDAALPAPRECGCVQVMKNYKCALCPTC